MRTLKKAELLVASEIHVPKSFKLPFTPSHSTAGPDAGRNAIVLGFDRTMVRMIVTRENRKFSLTYADRKTGNCKILKNGKTFVTDVRIVPTLLHAPSQVFINIDAKCRYRCLFCPSPLLPAGCGEKTLEEKMRKVFSLPEGSFDAIAVTSGIPISPEDTVDKIIEVVKRLKAVHRDATVGVETYTTNPATLVKLKNAGVEEMKLNIQSADKETFRKVCPQMDYDGLLKTLLHAPKLFSRGKVCSNILIGLGESDENVLDCVELLARHGVVANLRLLRVQMEDQRLSSLLSGKIRRLRSERLIYLAGKQKEILCKHGLGTQTFKTMCHRCGCCDIVPFLDV